MYDYKLTNGYYLAHHGIKGQKWGDRNGPPYPLKPEMHSASEKRKNKKFSKKLYSSMKRNRGKLNRVDYAEDVKKRISSDKRVNDYVKKHSSEYNKLFDEWSLADNAHDAALDKAYGEAYKKAVKNGANPDEKYFDLAVDEYLNENKEVQSAYKSLKDASAKLDAYAKNYEPLVNELLGKYADKPANAIYDTNVKAKKWVEQAIDSLMVEESFKNKK